MKRIALFVATNIAVLIVVAVFVNILGLGKIADANGLNLGALLVLSAIIGFAGAIISLHHGPGQCRRALVARYRAQAVSPRRHQDA